MKDLLKWNAMVGLCWLAVGCGGAPLEGEGSDAELSFEVAEEGLSTNEGCEGGSAHKTTDGKPGSFTTSSNYDPAHCHDAYLINANNYEGYTPLTVNPKMVQVNTFTHSVDATNEADCEKRRVGVYVWKGADFVGSSWQWGDWISGSCSAARIQPSIAFGIGRTETASDYRFAVSARTYPTAGIATGSYTRDAIRSTTSTMFIP